MGSEPARRYVEEVVRALLLPVLEGAGPRGWTLQGWDAEQGICLTFVRDRDVLYVEIEARDEGHDCYARTERFNVGVRRMFEDVDTNTEDRRVADFVVGVLREREKSLPDIERPTTARRRAVREIEVDRLLIPEGRGHYYVNAYVGCMIGCPFCYVAERADLSRRLEGLPRIPWGRYLDVKVNAPEVLRREVGEHPPGIVRMSPILTDPYQAIEQKYRITRGCLEVLLEAGFAPAVLTRAARISDDIELLKRFDRALVGFSIPTDDDRMRAIFEPGSDPIEARLEALRACHAAGLNTVAFVQPVLPLDVDRLVSEVAPYVSAVRIDRMYAMEVMRAVYAEHGLQEAATDAFFEDVIPRLERAFAARGIPREEMDDLSGLA